ncbi:MAG TPA: hypothetical protein ENN52_01915 [Methanofollis liminatans]|uniref:Uncharacterized protein n=1 Tax=Methanofollis liminatans TaxID=2201 RepID=A0A831LYG1_9EURY|nr:hypothetical protein [Methanofollis liminatans]
MNEETGTLRLGSGDNLSLIIGGERYRIAEDDLRTLLFRGHPAPVTMTVAREGVDGVIVSETTIVGYAGVNLCARAVKIFTLSGHFIVPLVSFRRVVTGEAVSAPLFPLVPEDSP